MTLADVPAIGLGCMNLSHAYGSPPSRSVAERILLRALDVKLSPQMIGSVDALINQTTVSGPRYNAATQAEIDTEEIDASRA
jgi:hypothetical protein